MPLYKKIIKKTSKLFKNSSEQNFQKEFTDGDIVFCKNNVCVHTPLQSRNCDSAGIHHPGYMVLKYQVTNDNYLPSLSLSWIPNEKLKNSQLVHKYVGDDSLSLCSFQTYRDFDAISISSYMDESESISGSVIEKSECELETHFVLENVNDKLMDKKCDSYTTNTKNKCENSIPRKRDIKFDPNNEFSTYHTGKCGYSRENFAQSSNSGLKLGFSCDGCSHSCKYCMDNLSEHSKCLLTNIVINHFSVQDIGRCNFHTKLDESNICDTNTKEPNINFKANKDIEEENISKEIKVSNCVLSNDANLNDASISSLNSDNKINIPDESSANSIKVTENEISLDKEKNSASYSFQNSVKHSPASRDGAVFSTIENLQPKCGNEDTSNYSTNNLQIVNQTEKEDECKISEEEKLISEIDDCIMRSPRNVLGSTIWLDRTAESLAISTNLAFPDSPTASVSSSCPTPAASWPTSIDGDNTPVRRSHRCNVFKVDLSRMKSLRLFFSNKEKTCGQLVIASTESQYKILHFHYGGLDKLEKIFEQWKILLAPDIPEDEIQQNSQLSTSKKHQKEVNKTVDSQKDQGFLKQFSVINPLIYETELHPDEGSLEYLDAETWLTYFSDDGSIEDELSLRRTVFLGGVDPQIRRNVWPFLLHYYDYRTTFEERQSIMAEKHDLYWAINESRLMMTDDERKIFWKEAQCTVEKDVVRTDRFKRCFAGVDNPNIEKMKNILLNFAFYHRNIGYTQGMSDILAPILTELRTEPDVFWCFAGMMSKTIFVTSPTDVDMEKNLKFLGELLRIKNADFFDFVKVLPGGLDLLFSHRWILLCFKREFTEDETLSMWEACWSNYQTDFFHLFIALAIINVYGKEVVEQGMKSDEMLLYFTSLANHMDGNLVLKKARGLLYQYRIRPNIPCTLVGLCELCGPGMWDSGHAPIVDCVGHGLDNCPASKILKQQL